MRVLKFGGTSVADAGRFRAVADIAVAAARETGVALVLSAPAGITNLLVALAAAGAAGRDGREELSRITGIVRPIIDSCARDFPAFDRAKVLSEFETALALIRRRVEGARLLGVCPEPVAAFIESRGETFSIAIMAELLRAMGRRVRVIDPVAVLAAEGGVMEASVNIEKSRARYQALEDDPEAITLMAGFCGGSAQGELVLLGRNGSDYSAACLAAISGAECCEIWTDVDAVYSCDPRFVPDAIPLRRMSYEEAMELSYFGAKVLHPRTIAPIARYHIPCLIKNTGNPRGEGTLISERTDQSLPIKGISDLKNISLINVTGPGMKGMVGMAGRLFTAVSRAGVSIALITQSSSEYSISFCVSTADLLRTRQAIDDEFALEFKEGLLNPLEIKDQCAIISVVGDGMRMVRGISGRFFRALAEANVNIRAIAQGSSERSISAVISAKRAAEAVAFAHTAFFNSRQRLELIVIGCGGIGGELLRQINRQQGKIADRHGVEIRVVCIANIDGLISDPQGIDLDNYEQLLKNGSREEFTVAKLEELVKSFHLINPVLVDCTASEKIALSYTAFMKEGAHIVTPSKKANTGSIEYYRELREAARVNHRKFLYEANVGAGLPVINTLQNELAAGDYLIEFSGIMSGTLSYIFGLVEDGYTLSQATLDAYEKGFTEPNPRDDLEGMDVARKVLILARECGYELELSDIRVVPAVERRYLEGGSAREVLENLKYADAGFSELVKQARAENKVLRYVARISDHGECFCGVVPVDESDPMYKIRGGENALAFTTAYYQPIPLVIRGYGAGASVTAAGVLADILRVQNWTRED